MSGLPAIRLAAVAGELLADGLSPGHARGLTGLSTGAVRRLLAETPAGRAAAARAAAEAAAAVAQGGAAATDASAQPPRLTSGPPPSAVARLRSLGAIFHATVLVERLSALDPAASPLRPTVRGDRGAALFQALWRSYAACPAGGAGVGDRPPPYADDAFDISAACGVFLQHRELVCDPCLACRTPVWRPPPSRRGAPMGCPVCAHARRVGLDAVAPAPLARLARVWPPAPPRPPSARGGAAAVPGAPVPSAAVPSAAVPAPRRAGGRGG